MVMSGIYVHETLAEPYATQIVTGKKTIETRNSDVLRRFVGKRVFIVRTRNHRKADIVGSVKVIGKGYWTIAQLDKHRDKTCIPVGSKYDATERGKWAYALEEPVELDSPIPLADVKIIHRTQSFAFFEFNNLPK